MMNDEPTGQVWRRAGSEGRGAGSEERGAESEDGRLKPGRQKSSRSTPHAPRPTPHAPRFDAALLIAALLTLFIVQSLLQPGLPATAADLPIHLYRTLEYERAWAPGVIAPRWAPDLAYGYGYPLFLFAPPLPYLVGMVFHALGLTMANALKALIILTIPLYAIGMYLLARDLLASVEAGLVATTAYAFAPFALREALLYGGNVPQFLAIGLFPWTLWAMSRAANHHAWRWTVLAAALYAGVILSHLFQALVFTPVVAGFGLLLVAVSGGWRKVWTNRTRPPLGLSLGTKSPPSPPPRAESRNEAYPSAPWQPLLTIPLGLLLSAFFWLPALIERTYTRAQADIYLAKSPFYVRFPHWSELVAWIQPLDARAANPYVPLTLGVVTLVLAGLGLLAGIWLWLQKHAEEPRSKGAEGQSFVSHLPPCPPAPLHPHPPIPLLIFFFALVAAGAVFLTLSFSRPIWETFSLLQVAEFPWRMLGVANLGLAFLAGAALLLAPARYRRPVTGVCLAIQLVAVAPLLYPVTPFTQYGEPTLADQINYERSSQSIGTTTLGEYLPQTVSHPPTTSPLVESYQANQIPERLDRASLPPGATAVLIEQSAVTHQYQLDSPVPFTLRLFQFDFPGWQAMLDDQPIPLRPEPETGLILVDIPAGQHNLTLHFDETPVRVAAIALTGLTLVGLMAAGIMGGRGAREQRGRGDQEELPSTPLPPRSPALTLNRSVLIIAILILAGALWFKPLLRPVFTLTSPANQALPAQQQTRLDFTNGISLIGYDLSSPVVPAGGYLQVVLYWQTGAAPHRTNLQPFVHLDRLDEFTTIADATNYTPGDVTTESNLPTFHWDNHRYIRDEHDLYLSGDTPPQAYAVRVGLIDPDDGYRLIPLADGGDDTAQLTTINVAPRRQPTPPTQRLNASFTNGVDTIDLTGFEITSLEPVRLDFKLAWQAEQRPTADYTVFAQLLDLDQNRVAGFDSPPLDGAYPTSTWLPGQIILEPRHLPLEQVAPGDYRLIIGLYDPATGQRLTTPAGADFVELTRVVINNR